MNQVDLQAVSQYISDTAQESQKIRDAFLATSMPDLIRAAQWVAETVKSGGKVLLLGNGGSAADAQHTAAEMVGRMLIERPALPAIALTTDTSNLTAIGNDYGYDFVFQRQVEAIARAGDVLIAISTSGKSKNVLLAAESAKKLGCKVIAVSGGEGGPLSQAADLALVARLGKNSSRIQETHIFILHSIVDVVDRFFLGQEKAK